MISQADTRAGGRTVAASRWGVITPETKNYKWRACDWSEATMCWLRARPIGLHYQLTKVLPSGSQSVCYVQGASKSVVSIDGHLGLSALGRVRGPRQLHVEVRVQDEVRDAPLQPSAVAVVRGRLHFFHSTWGPAKFVLLKNNRWFNTNIAI